jgi:hypothetical protein
MYTPGGYTITFQRNISEYDKLLLRFYRYNVIFTRAKKDIFVLFTLIL